MLIGSLSDHCWWILGDSTYLHRHEGRTCKQPQPCWYDLSFSRTDPKLTHLQGFLALAQLPVVFLFGTKNSIVSLLLGPGHGYEKLNYIHRWSGRGLFIGAAVHGVLWIRNHLQYGLAILGSQKETSGVAAFGLLCVIVLTSLRPIRRLFYQGFWVVHVLGYVAFFVTICYHTIYASPWIFPPLAFYGLDILLRLFRYRIKDASLTAVDQNMTIVRILLFPSISQTEVSLASDQYPRLRRRLASRPTRPPPCLLLQPDLRISPTYHSKRTPFILMPPQQPLHDPRSSSMR